MKKTISMRLSTKTCFLLVFICLFFIADDVFSQTIPLQGSPFINSYTSAEINGGPQIWGWAQDNRGMVYVGDISGVIEFNGREWRRIETANNSIVRNMAVDSLGCVYVGCSDDFGMLQPNSRGQMEYKSIAQPIIDQNIKFLDIWKVFASSHGIYFCSNKYVFRYHKNKLTTIPVDFYVQDAYLVNDLLYLPTKKGMCLLNDTLLTPVTEKIFFLMTPKIGDETIAIDGTNGEPGTFNLQTKGFSKFGTPINKYLKNNGISSIHQIDDNKFVLVTGNNDLIVVSGTGKLLQIINKGNGLISGVVNSIFVDRDKNLWVCMSKGVAKIDMNYPATKFGEAQNVTSNVQTSCLFNGKRYIATLDGIYYLSDYNPEEPDRGSHFIKIDNIDGECWNFNVLNNRLYAVCSSGIWMIDGEKARNIYRIDAPQKAHCFCVNPLFPNTFFVGLRGKLEAIRLSNGSKASSINVIEKFDFPEVTEKIRRITVDKDGNLWLNTQFDGVYFVRFMGGDIRNYKVALLGEQNGLPDLGGTRTYLVNNEINITTGHGILAPKFPAGEGAPDSLIRFEYSTIFGDTIADQVGYIAPVAANKYIVAGNGMHYATVDGSKQLFDSCGFNRLGCAVASFNVNADSLVSISATEGLYYYNTKNHRDFKKTFNTIISKVEINNDSLLFGGCFYSWNDSVQVASLTQTTEFIPTIEYKFNSLTFHFAGLFYEDPDATEFQHQLVGFDKTWSNWSNDNKAVYTNLREGKYTFRVKAQNVYDAQSNVDEYHFTISAPWYRSWWAISIYILLSIAVIYLAMWLYARRLKLQKEYLELVVEERTGEIIEQARELKTINEKLVEMDKFKQGITSMIVHDLKNPINAIINSSDKQPETQLERIKQTGRQMLNLVLNILDVSKYEEAKIELTIANRNLHNISSKAIEQVHFLSTEKNITLSNLIKPELGIRADAEMIERVFVNILTNAIKYTPNNGLIVLKADAQSEDGFLKISITDNGIGIPADKTHLVFQRFGQVVAKNSGSVRSTGLGLTYCKMVIEAHGGNIGVESEQEKGSTFWFTLPASSNVEVLKQQAPMEKTIRQIELSEANRALIKEQLDKLQETEFYKITELFTILEKIDDTGNQEIRTWKQALTNAIDSGNELLYKKLL
jgi:signal transduction histidine kinase